MRPKFSPAARGLHRKYYPRDIDFVYTLSNTQDVLGHTVLGERLMVLNKRLSAKVLAPKSAIDLEKHTNIRARCEVRLQCVRLVMRRRQCASRTQTIPNCFLREFLAFSCSRKSVLRNRISKISQEIARKTIAISRTNWAGHNPSCTESVLGMIGVFFNAELIICFSTSHQNVFLQRLLAAHM
jgi:hypothetical protein